MLSVELSPPNATRAASAPLPAGYPEAVLAELSPILFSSLSRSDQCRKGMQYVRGLLEADGRKSIRNIAALLGGEASEQNLHHFISGSTWDWTPVRRALARHVVASAPPQAWVLQPMIIPKTGRQSVGVDRHFFPTLGRVLNAQCAIGVWAASAETSVPVNWRLHLPRAWLKDDLRRSQGAIPEGLGEESVGECVAQAATDTATRWELPPLPVVFDAREAQIPAVLAELGSRDVPFLVRIGRDLQLAVPEAAPAARPGQPLPAHQIMTLARGLLRPVATEDRGPEGPRRTCLAAAVRVHLPASQVPAAAGRELLLLGIAEEGEPWPSALWLTSLTGTAPAALVALSRLTERVERDFTEVADRVGIRDYSGRSFGGWHRHVTLASAAHAVVALSGRAP
ncbi:transposase [Streptomyces sp. NPDC097619]|uniref:IS701 family transposase n=1 Tax=Streptomyces sp. NPDC097619 TaxID=3157228 RepID=UPI00331F7771